MSIYIPVVSPEHLLTRSPIRSNMAGTGCQQFEVHVRVHSPPTVVLYEIYNDRAAFEAHLQTPHFFRWRDAGQDSVTDRRISLRHRRR
jgi:quinol monooxygenase YgiN